MCNTKCNEQALYSRKKYAIELNKKNLFRYLFLNTL